MMKFRCHRKAREALTQRTLLGEEVAESRTLLGQVVAVVQLYRALGGGWEDEQGPATIIPPARRAP